MSKLEAVVLYKIDCEKGEGIALAKEFKVLGYPTFVLANAEGETIYRWMGYTKPLLFEKMESGFSDLTTIAEKKERYNKKADLKTALLLAEYRSRTRL